MLDKQRPEKRLMTILPKKSGRDVSGHISVRHQGGRHKRYYRMVDFLRNKTGVSGRVVSIEYDPNRSANIALVYYSDGDKKYILSPRDLKIGQVVVSSDNADINIGNALPLENIPVGTPIHNVELVVGRGAKLARGAGIAAVVLAKEGEFVQVKLPSGEIRKIPGKCMATVGQIGNEERRNIIIGKAGRARNMGKRPEVRGVAQNPRSHPHGGGEGRSGIGMKSPKSPWGKRTLGKKTRQHHKYSDKFIISRKKLK